jgi:hypothetical protein
MNRVLSAEDLGDVRGPGHTLLAGAVELLHRLIRWSTPTADEQARDDLTEVRRLADHAKHTDPGLARDLWAIAARHEAALDAQPSPNS